MKTNLTYKVPKTLLNKGTGFLNGYTHTMNPYTGCAFGCSYCYVRQMPVSLFRKEDWGSWVDVKQEASRVFAKELQRAQTKGKVTLFMSSSTDPYQPAEYKECITRSLLETMLQHPPDFVLVQTRSPLVTRDIDLLQQLGNRVRVSMTVETDLDDMRKHFSPSAPPIAGRLRALEQLRDAGIPTQVAIAPVLPSSEQFAAILRPLVQRVCIDDYFMGDGSEGKRTRRLGMESIYQEVGMEHWYHPDAYQTVVQRMKDCFAKDEIWISQAGFEP
ncbi:radical SAM protein [Paenibacillus sp. FSL R5-0490]|uniref:SPL family radical SAM protein n=1 Tax=Paenibacillus sp. FSL R5-0490 TaxID=1920424 RepID=UPI0030CE7569